MNQVQYIQSHFDMESHEVQQLISVSTTFASMHMTDTAHGLIETHLSS